MCVKKNHGENQNLFLKDKPTNKAPQVGGAWRSGVVDKFTTPTRSKVSIARVCLSVILIVA